MMGWVFAWRKYLSQQLLSVQKHLSQLLQLVCQLLMFQRQMYLGPVFFTYSSCHKTVTSVIPCASFFPRLSPLPHHASFKIREIDCASGFNRSCPFCQQGSIILCCWISAAADIVQRVERVMKVTVNVEQTRISTHLLFQHFPVDPEENYELLSHYKRSEIESDYSVYKS